MDTNDMNLKKVCRVCLLIDSDPLVIFDERNSVDGVSISDMLSECTNNKVQRFDDFPQLICHNCLENVKTAYKFKKLCETSYRKITDILNKSLVLSEDTSLLNEKATQTDEASIYPCERCDDKFYSYERLRDHRLAKHKGCRNDCRICNRSFVRLSHLKSHMSINHPEAGYGVSHLCHICNKQFTRREHLRRHLLNVHKFVKEQIQYNCKKCLNSFESELGSIGHICNPSVINNDKIKYDNEILHEPEIPFENEIDASGSNIINCENEFGNESEEFKESIWINQEDFHQSGISSNDEFDDEENESKPLAFLFKKKLQNKKKEILETIVIESGDEQTPSTSKLNKTDKKIPISKEKTNLKEEKRHECPECKKTFSRSSHVKRHLITHMAKKPFECKICRKTFGRMEHLKNHLRTHTDERPFACEICNRRFIRKEHLKSHCQNRHAETPPAKNEICEVCSKGFTTKKYLTLHMRSHLEKKFACKLCSETYGTKADLQEHAKTHGNEKPFLCSECGLRFVRNDYLIIHMRRHNGEKPYKCKFCDKGFPRATDLNVHEKYHTGEKPHLCNTCGKGFHRAYNLVVHMRVHTGERPYKCSHCTKSFTQCNDLKAHVRRHTGERFKCEVCGEGFIQGYHLSQHKRNVHGIESFSHIRRLEKFIGTKEETQQPPLAKTTIVQPTETNTNILLTYPLEIQAPLDDATQMESLSEHLSVKLENNFDENRIKPSVLPLITNVESLAIIEGTDLNTPDSKFYSKVKFEQMD